MATAAGSWMIVRGKYNTTCLAVCGGIDRLLGRSGERGKRGRGQIDKDARKESVVFRFAVSPFPLPGYMSQATYIHGTDSEEQARLALLNRLTNQSFIDFLDLRNVRTILEIGSGLGILAAEIATGHPKTDVWGIEYATQQLEVAKEQFPPNLHFVQGDAHQLPFNNSRFEVVYCRYVLEHVADPNRVLTEARRILKPGGKVCVQENNILALELYPNCPHFDHVWHQFVQLQAQLGGDGQIGKKLFPLFQMAGFQYIELSVAPEIHWAGMPTFRPWVENLMGNVRSGADALQQRELATAGEIAVAIEELRAFGERADASLFFYWNRAVGRKAG